MRKILPGMFTLGNLLCGFLAVTKTVEGAYIPAAWWIIIAGIFDALDGKVARLTGGGTDFGIEFDSIADVVSFGLAPAVLIYTYMFTDTGNAGYILAFSFLGAGAYRLARFNLTATTGKKYCFTGMPIPAGAGILAAFILFSENVWGGFAKFDFSMVLVLMISMAMVSKFKYSPLPKISFNTGKDTVKSIWFIAYMMLVILFPDEVFFPTGILYLLSGPAKYVTAPALHLVASHVFHKADSG